jgi:hypothetical protein
LKQLLILPPFANLHFSFPNVIAKHDWCCIQFTDSTGKFACGAQFCTFKALQLLFYSYWKVLKVSSVSVVQNEQSSPEITFKVIKESLLVFLNTSQKVADYLLQ